jgi:hypothetical protein
MLVSRRFLYVATLTTTGIAAMLVACNNSGQSGTADGSASAATVASELAAAQDSLASAQATAKDCFTAYRTCESTAGQDAKTCRDQLTACLPTTAPTPTSCAQGVAGASAKDTTVKSDAQKDTAVKGVAGAPSRVESEGDQAARPEAQGDAEKGMGENGIAGAPNRGEEEGQMGVAGARAMGDNDHEKGVAGARPVEDNDSDDDFDHAARCKAPAVEKGKLGDCRDAASKSLEQGTDSTSASTAHQACVKDTFDKAIGEICKIADKVCGTSNASTKECTTIESVCSTKK